MYLVICDTEVHTFVSYVTHVVHKAIVHIRATTYAWWCTYNRNLDNRYMPFSITYDQVMFFRSEGIPYHMRIFAHTRMGRSIRVWNGPYTYGYPHGYGLSHTCTGNPYA